MKNIINRVWSDLKKFWIAILLFLIWNVTIRKIFHAFCPSLIITGFPCAGCGMTRAIFYMLTGRFIRSMKLNPAAPLWILFFLWFFWNRYVRDKYQKSTMFWLGVVCMVTLFIYTYRMIYKFPGDPPMVYYPNNILRTFLRFHIK